MNTNNPDILFFVRREYGTPSIELRAIRWRRLTMSLLSLNLNVCGWLFSPVIFSLYHFITSTVKTTVCIIVPIIYRI